MMTPFAYACSASLLLHAALLGVPAGSLSQGGAGGHHMPASRLEVRLEAEAQPQGGHPLLRPASAQPARAQAAADALPVGIPAPRYYEATEVTLRAKAIGDIAPLPPRLADDAAGRLVLILRIGSDGRVDDVDVGDSTVGDRLTSAFAERFRALRFHPAERDGIAVASRMKVEVLLRPRGA